MANNRLVGINPFQRNCPPEDIRIGQITSEKRTWTTSSPPAYRDNWESALKGAFEQVAERIFLRMGARVGKLEHDFKSLSQHCKELKDGQSLIVPVETLVPDNYTLKRSFAVVVRPSDNEY